MGITCPRCGGENRRSKRFCIQCGGALVSRCARCRSESPAGKKFCGECGAPICGARNGPAGGNGSRPASGATAVTDARPHAVEPNGERRQLTVVFCDLVGSTPLSQQLDPEEWRDVLAQYQRAAAAAVDRWGGHVARELGDGLLIYFGWPDAREDDPERAVRAGLAIVEGVKRSGGTKDPESEDAASNPIALSVRVGIHTGAVLIDDSGEVFGETPNVAARVQSAAQPDTVVVTAATQRLVAGVFVVEDYGPQALKGVREPVTLYRVLQPSGVRSRLDVAAGHLTRFVGRDMELGTLIDRWERAIESQGQNVLVLGEAGVGKSRLAYQLRERLAAMPHTWLECRATPYAESAPFFPVIELVQQGLAFTAEDSAREKIAKLERSLSAVGLAGPEAVALLADFLGLPLPDARAPLRISPELRRRKTIELLAAWNLALGRVQPLVLLMEDLHWCDPSSLELLSRVIDQSASARVLVIASARPEFTPPWAARANLTTLQLARLTKRQAREMVMGLSGGALAADVVETLVARADGVPLYIEELTKAVIEPGAAHGVESIPATLADSLMARLDRLSTAKEVAQRAAVLGREFGYGLLAATAGIEEGLLRQGLARLVEAEIVFARGEPPHATYTFKHALVQEAAYASLLKRTRQQLHDRVVDVLVAQFPARVAAEPDVVARHAEAAGRIDEAIAYLQCAGGQAQARSAHGEAIAQLRRALALLARRPAGGERDAREVALQLACGASLVAISGYAHPDTEAAYERTRTLAEAARDAAPLGIARIGLAICSASRGEMEVGRALAAEVLAAAEARGDAEQALMAHINVAIPEHFQGNFASSIAHCERALALYDPARHHALARVLGTDQAVAGLGYAAWTLWHLGRPDAALTRAEEAVRLAERLEHPFSLAFALFWETALHSFRRDAERQRRRAAQVIALSETQGFPLWLGLGRAFHDAAAITAGDAAALSGILDGISLVGQTGNQSGAPGIFLLLAEAQQAVGEERAAQATATTGLAAAAKTGQRFWDADLQRLEGDLFDAVGAPAQARVCYETALATARAQGSRALELRVATRLARLLRAQRRGAEAHALLAPLFASFNEGFDTRDLIDAKALLAELG